MTELEQQFYLNCKATSALNKVLIQKVRTWMDTSTILFVLLVLETCYCLGVK